MSHSTRFRAIIRQALHYHDALEKDPGLKRSFKSVWHGFSRLPPYPEDERLWARIVAEESGRMPRREREKRPKPEPEGQGKLFGGDE